MSPCQHTTTEFVRTPDGPHHGKTLCVECGRFLRWEKKPETLSRETENRVSLERLAALPGLTAWERGFLASLKKQRKFSPKQQARLLDLAIKYKE